MHFTNKACGFIKVSSKALEAQQFSSLVIWSTQEEPQLNSREGSFILPSLSPNRWQGLFKSHHVTFNCTAFSSS